MARLARGTTKRSTNGILESFDVSLAEAQELVMTARVMLGWVDPEDLLQNDDAEEVEEE